ncbi:ParA family protein [Sphingomonas crocodyli]|uniref:ParA family protein n=1 Tax=Sphingomonas crocodyli TaxID=1979270 RepID=A0A437LY44_9SPHN|nr:ParA family protein [Sphingomonas crocodyli]RVT90321.1 hypothetical protein EOD43_18805 [Sphingomonas crocodyli]
MPVVALASSKGGCGKSTTALILASAFTADGYTVNIIDADRSGRLMKWGSHGGLPDTLSVESADEKTLRGAIEASARKADVTIIDVEGSANMGTALAIGYADVVIVPANPSAPDVEDAVATVALIRDTAGMAKRHIPHALLWSRVPPAIRSREIAALANQVLEGGIPVVGQVIERTAYKSLFSYATTLDRLPAGEVPSLDKAKAEATEVAEAIIALIGSQNAEVAA